MSISTGSIGSCSYPTCGSAEDCRQESKVVRDGWKDELANRIHIYEGDIDGFLSNFVPSSSCPPPKRLLPSVFRGWEPRQGKEVLMYPVLLDAFDKLVIDVPKDKRLSFSICADQVVPPFEDHADHHKTKPDLVVSFPGEKLPRQQVDPSWQNFSMAMEAKATESDDPFNKKGEKHVNTLVQLAISARNLFFAHGFLAAFVVGLYGDHARIARFDHSCAVVSPRFPYKLRPELLRQFFWRFAHPCVGSTVVGCDPAVRKLDLMDIEWVKECLTKKGGSVAPLRDEDMLKGRHVTVPSSTTATDTSTKDLILFDLLDVNSRLFSRATMVWLAMEDKHSMSDPESGIPVVTVYKENWHQIVRRPETDFYDRLDVIAEERIGLPKMLYGSDVGDREVQVWKANGGVLPPRYGAQSRDTSASFESSSASSVSSSSGSSSASSLFSSAGVSTSSLEETVPTEHEDHSDLPTCPPLPPPSEYSLPFPQYQTHTWRRLFGEEQKYRERSLVRTVVDVVGRPLVRFRSTRELAEAMRDAIKGHKQAWDLGILQRDISVGNILITEDLKERSRGFLHDFDYSSMTKDIPTPEDPGRLDPLLRTAEAYPDDGKERTGTYYYFAVELLAEKNISHTLTHDLESFYWVLLWVVLRHTRHDLVWVRDEDPCGRVFKYGNDDDAADTKEGWIKRGRLTVENNGPLTDLLCQFKDLVKMCNIAPTWNPDLPRPFISHKKVLQIFDDALARKDWPSGDGDAAVPFKRKRKDQPTIASGLSKRKTESQLEPASESSGTVSKKARSVPAHATGGSTRGRNGGRTGERAATRKRRSTKLKS